MSNKNLPGRILLNSVQMYRLEAEQKRLDEDLLVYNRLQEQLKHSPAFKKVCVVNLHFFTTPSLNFTTYMWLISSSAAYQIIVIFKMFEVASQMESQADSRLSDEYSDSEISDISFEEFLAQEKKDSFW